MVNGFKINNVRVYGVEEALVAQGYPMMTGDMFDYSEDELEFRDGAVYVKDSDELVRKVNAKATASLAGCKPGTGHDSFLKGIVIAFDVKYPVYWTPQFQRYHFMEITSSSSTMHRLAQMEIDTAFSDNTPKWAINNIKKMVDAYNKAVELEKTESNVLIVESYKESLMNEYGLLMCEVTTENIDDIVKFHNRGIFTTKEYFNRIVAACPQGLMKTMRVVTNALQIKTICVQRKNHKLPEWRYFCEYMGTLPFWKTVGVDPLNF